MATAAPVACQASVKGMYKKLRATELSPIRTGARRRPDERILDRKQVVHSVFRARNMFRFPKDPCDAVGMSRAIWRRDAKMETVRLHEEDCRADSLRAANLDLLSVLRSTDIPPYGRRH